MENPARSNKALVHGTLAFATTFAIWGLLSGLMPILKKDLALTASQASLLVAAPVMVGSLGRIPAGILADRFGGKRVMAAILFLVTLPALLLGLAKGYDAYIAVATLLGIAGTSFSVGITLVSRWFPPSKQGTSLGIYGAGNFGQSVAVFGAPALASVFGLTAAIWTFAAASLVYAVVFARSAEDAPWNQPRKSFAEQARLLFSNWRCWTLSWLYFQTFGGFVALSIYMPMLLKELFALSPSDAGFRTAMFVVLATICRPLGGYLSDRLNASHILVFVFNGLVPCAFMMTSPDLGYFTIGALGAAALVGLGNGAVFKLVPHYFPKDVGTVTGLVGAAGGLGGFFPPLVLGYCRDHLGTYNFGFYCLAAFAIACLLVLYITVRERQPAAKDMGGEELPVILTVTEN